MDRAASQTSHLPSSSSPRSRSLGSSSSFVSLTSNSSNVQSGVATSSSPGPSFLRSPAVVVVQSLNKTLFFSSQCPGHCLHSIANVPAHLRYQHILHGYRPSGLALHHCARSLLAIHNQTGNVWSHLLGLLVVLYLLFVLPQSLAVSSASSPSWLELCLLLVFYVCAAWCMTCSCVFHLFHCHSPDSHSKLLKADMLGVLALVWASYLPALHLAFRCHTMWRDLYMVLISALILACAYLISHSHSHGSLDESQRDRCDSESEEASLLRVVVEDISVSSSLTSPHIHSASMVAIEMDTELHESSGKCMKRSRSCEYLPVTSTPLHHHHHSLSVLHMDRLDQREPLPQSRPLYSSSPSRSHAHLVHESATDQKQVWLMASLVFFAVMPAAHWISIASSSELEHYLPPLVAMLGFYALGFFFYRSRFPECRWPGRFDIWFHSHQLWHLCVVLAILVWEWTLIKAFVVRGDTQQACVD